MDEAAALEHHRLTLLRLVAGLFVMVGAGVDRLPVPFVKRHVQQAVLRVLGAAESAARRLISIEARDMEAPEHKKRPAPSHPIPKGTGSTDRIPPFKLFDPRKSFPEFSSGRRRPKGAGPRMTFFDEDEWTPYEPPPVRSPDDLIDAARLCARMRSLDRALKTLRAQAKRLVRMQARRKAASKVSQPLRPGWPPGYRQTHVHEVDAVLRDCNIFAHREPRPPDRT